MEEDEIETSNEHTSRMERIHEQVRLDLEWSKVKTKEYYDKKRSDAPELKVGSYVYLRRRTHGKKDYNIQTKRPSNKLDCVHQGPLPAHGAEAHRVLDACHIAGVPPVRRTRGVPADEHSDSACCRSRASIPGHRARNLIVARIPRAGVVSARKDIGPPGRTALTIPGPCRRRSNTGSDPYFVTITSPCGHRDALACNDQGRSEV